MWLECIKMEQKSGFPPFCISFSSFLLFFLASSYISSFSFYLFFSFFLPPFFTSFSIIFLRLICLVFSSISFVIFLICLSFSAFFSLKVSPIPNFSLCLVLSSRVQFLHFPTVFFSFLVFFLFSSFFYFPHSLVSSFVVFSIIIIFFLLFMTLFPFRSSSFFLLYP